MDRPLLLGLIDSILECQAVYVRHIETVSSMSIYQMAVPLDASWCAVPNFYKPKNNHHHIKKSIQNQIYKKIFDFTIFFYHFFQ